MKELIKITFIVLFIFTPFVVIGQQLFYSDILHGGITGNGGSVANGSGVINLSVQIPPNSTIKKSFLIAARDSLADDITIALSGINYSFSDSTIITSGFNAFKQGPVNRPNSSIHAIDITMDINSSVNNYSLTIPSQFNSVKGVYSFFYIYIVYENLFLNVQDVAPITFYNLNNLTPIDNNKIVGLGVNTLQLCDTVLDGSYVKINNDTLGLIGGDDLNSSLWTCVGPWANFAHYNDSLFGLDDDTPDSLMAATDALADIKSYVNNGDTTVDITFIYQTLDNSNGGILTNPIRAVMLSYSTPCDTFTTNASASQDTICQGESVQLNATGGVAYSWFGAFGGISDTSIANPTASPPQTTTYIVTIKNDSGCVKTAHVKIWVNPPPVPDTLLLTHNFCGDSLGSMQVGNIANGEQPYHYQLTNLSTFVVQSQTSNLFNELGTAAYQLQITNAKGCVFTDTFTINQSNRVVANFLATPPSGVAPLEVFFENTSLYANGFQWWVMDSELDTLQSATCNACNHYHTFEQAGTYQTCLVAYNNLPTCADTVCKTIIAKDSIRLVLPNVFTPNNDAYNDVFELQLTGASLVKELSVEIFNRWGKLVNSKQWQVATPSNNYQEFTLWEGKTTNGTIVPQGTYFYVLNYQTTNGTTEALKGSVTVFY